jgi:cation transporter-like permease
MQRYWSSADTSVLLQENTIKLPITCCTHVINGTSLEGMSSQLAANCELVTMFCLIDV